MSGDQVIRCLELLCAWSLLLQTLEYWRIGDSTDPTGVWSWPVQRADIPASPAWVLPCLDWLYQPAPYRALLWLRGLAALSLALVGANLGNALVLFVIQLLILVRWRGAFNGGSDFMTLVALTGILLAQVLMRFVDPSMAWGAGLGYIGIHTLSSYFVSGWVKLMRPEWRSGRALTVFLDHGVYGPLPENSIYRWPRLAMLCSWCFTLWEGLFPLALLDVRLAAMFCATASVFHFLVFWFFGLNRFFWAWLSTFPAILYCASV